jgi:hypothetical protein
VRWTFFRGAATVADGVVAEHGEVRMNREGALLVMIAVASPSWRWGIRLARRSRRDAGITAPFGEIPEPPPSTASTGFYVATTRHGEALERLAIRGLGFRSRVDVTVTDRGVALDLVGRRGCSSRRAHRSVDRPPRPSTASSSRAASSASPGARAPTTPRRSTATSARRTVRSGTRRCDHRHPAASTPTATDQTSTTSTGNAA